MKESKEAMKLALDALDEFCELGAIIRPLEVRDALREALAEQPAQQNPAAWMTHTEGFLQPLFHKTKASALNWQANPKPLYESPPKRPWVDLTKEEVGSWELPDCPTVFEFVQFIEAKIKDKNT